MKNQVPKISSEIAKILPTNLGFQQIVPITQGASNAQVFKLKFGDGKKAYLKINPDLQESLIIDKQIYEFLAGKIKVPEVLFFQQMADYELIILSEIEGQSLAELVTEITPQEIINLYAHTLKDLHSIPIENCRLINSLDHKLAIASQKVKNNSLLPTDWEEENQSYSPQELLNLVLAQKPDNQQLVFTHGDYCLDNILVKNRQFNGLIDMGRGGVADKYQDLALAIRSIRHELEAILKYIKGGFLGLKK